jgi:hypothetical protein
MYPSVGYTLLIAKSEMREFANRTKNVPAFSLERANAAVVVGIAPFFKTRTFFQTGHKRRIREGKKIHYHKTIGAETTPTLAAQMKANRTAPTQHRFVQIAPKSH